MVHEPRIQRPAKRVIASLIQRLSRPSVAAIADQGVVSMANFLTGVVLARGLSQSQFGVYALGLSVVLLILDLQTSLTSTPYMVFGPQLDQKGRYTYLTSTMVHQVAIGILIAVGLTVTGLAIQMTNGGELGAALLILGMVVALILFRDFARRICFADQQPASALLLDILATVLQLGAILMLLWSDALTVATAFLAIGLATGIPSIIWILIRRRQIHFSYSAVTQDLKKNWQFGKWVLFSGALWASSLHFYPWLLAFAQGTSATAVWAVGLGVVSIANPLKLGYQNHLGPEISNRHASGGMHAVRNAVRAGSRRFILIISPVVLLLILFGGEAAVLIYGDDYSGLGLLVGILAVDLLVSVVAFSFSRGLFALNQAYLDMKVNFVAVGVLATTGIWLAWSMGPVGAAIGLLLANLAATTIRGRAFFRVTERPT